VAWVALVSSSRLPAATAVARHACRSSPAATSPSTAAPASSRCGRRLRAAGTPNQRSARGLNEALSKDRASFFSEAFSRDPLERQPVRDPMLLAEVVAYRLCDLPLVLVVASREAADVFVRDLLIVFDMRSAVYPDPAVFVLDDQTHPRI